MNPRIELKSLVATNLDKAFENFEHVLATNDPLYNDLLILKGRYIDTRKYFNLNIADKADIDIELNKIRRALIDLIDTWKPSQESTQEGKSYQDLKNHLRQFPWTELLNKGLIHLFGMQETLFNGGKRLTNHEIVHRTEQYVARNQIKNHRDIQISIIDNNRTFIFHDGDYMIGSWAMHRDIVNGTDIYNTVFSYPYGVVSWIDETSNHAKNKHEFKFRENIALFAELGDARIVVELHNER